MAVANNSATSAPLVLQMGGRRDRPVKLVKSRDGQLTVGRGLQNDLIVSDPFVAASQICFQQLEGNWFVEVLDQTNEVLLNGKPLVQSCIQVDSGDQLIIGRTHLYVRHENDSVEPTRQLVLSRWLHHGVMGSLLPVLLLFAVGLLDFMLDYFQTSLDHKWQPYAVSSLGLAIVVLVWSGIWAIAGRLLRHQPQFGIQLFLGAMVTGGVVIAMSLVGYIEYLTHSVRVTEFMMYGIYLVAIALLLKFNLFFATHVYRTGLAGLVASAVFLTMIYISENHDKEDFSPEPVYSRVIKPPFAHVTGEESIDDYLATMREKVAAME